VQAWGQLHGLVGDELGHVLGVGEWEALSSPLLRQSGCELAFDARERRVLVHHHHHHPKKIV
jgi:hypothetical protein